MQIVTFHFIKYVLITWSRIKGAKQRDRYECTNRIREEKASHVSFTLVPNLACGLFLFHNTHLNTDIISPVSNSHHVMILTLASHNSATAKLFNPHERQRRVIKSSCYIFDLDNNNCIDRKKLNSLINARRKIYSCNMKLAVAL